MDQNKIDMFMATSGSKFPEEKQMMLKELLSKVDDNKFNMIQAISYKDPTTMLIFSLFLGSYGVDRFMLGETGAGVGKLLTCGGMGIWTIVDWFTVQKRTREFNWNKLQQMAM